jgi:hypothetical protein
VDSTPDTHPDDERPHDPEHHQGWFVDVWTGRPLTDDEKAVIKTAVWHICHDNLEHLDDWQLDQGLLVEVHEAPVPKEGGEHLGEAL